MFPCIGCGNKGIIQDFCGKYKPVFLQKLQELAGIASFHLRYFLGRTLGHDGAAAVAALGAQVDDVIGGLDHVQVMLDHQHRVARVGEALQAP